MSFAKQGKSNKVSNLTVHMNTTIGVKHAPYLHLQMLKEMDDRGREGGFVMWTRDSGEPTHTLAPCWIYDPEEPAESYK